VSLAFHIAWANQVIGKPDEARNALHGAEMLGLRRETRDPLERRILDRLREQLAGDRSQTLNRH